MDIGTQVLLFLFATIVITPMIIVLLMPLGVLLSPFAALICYLRARSMGLPPGYYARIGALYSTILFLPWIYLIVRMFGKTVPNILIGMGYFVLYTMWALGSILTISLMTFVYGVATFSFNTEVDSRYVYALGFCIFLILLCVNVLMWILSMVRLDRFHRNSVPNERILPNRVYMTPFAYALVWIVVAVIVWFVGLYIPNEGSPV